jgi:hypothetical protein
MRLTIIPSEKKISIDGEPITGCDVSWIPEFVGDITGVSQKVHALQWDGDHGEIELVTRDNNIVITELGVFEQAVSIHAEKKAILEAEAAEAEAEKVAADLEAEQEALLYGGGVDIDQLLAELESDDNNENVGIAST